MSITGSLGDIGSNANRQQRSISSLNDQLHRQVKYLIKSAALFDEGDYEESIRLAVTLRVLLYDHGSSRSLLEQTGLKSSLLFVDTGVYEEDLKRVMAEDIAGRGESLVFVPAPGDVGLVEMGTSPDGYPAWVAPLREQRFSPADPIRNALSSPSPFDKWWKTPLIQGLNRVQFSREKLILIMANQDGGAHVDANLDVDYEQLWVDHLGVRYVNLNDLEDFDPNKDYTMDGDLELNPVDGNIAGVSVRQITFELMSTLSALHDFSYLIPIVAPRPRLFQPLTLLIPRVYSMSGSNAE